MNLADLVAIDIHVHAEFSCRQPRDPIQSQFDKAATVYFKTEAKRPTIAETIAYYRERRIGFVMFTVDSEAGTGIKRISNEEIAEAAAENSDIMLAFASIDPHKGKTGAIEARRLIADYGVKGFKFHGPMQDFDAGSRCCLACFLPKLRRTGAMSAFHLFCKPLLQMMLQIDVRRRASTPIQFASFAK